MSAPVALVTGAARRIGRTIALALARDGWDVGVHYGASRDNALATVLAIEALGRRAVALPCDLANAASVRRLVADCSSALGSVICLVNNASLFAEDRIDSISAETLQRHMQVNVAAPLLLAQALHAALPADARGVVINLLDQKLFNPNPDYLSYTLSKAALHEATTLLAQALAPRLRVVGVAPGITLTSGDQTETGFAKAHTKTPLGRSSTPEDVAAAVVYLARAQAVTGTTLLVDGGQHLVPSPRDVMFLTQ
ncbi:MAG: SDR family oxidoreductase [Burkholderiales bacterium]|nr:SDR family oxidoreductase [Burkholderiales bacterium]